MERNSINATMLTRSLAPRLADAIASSPAVALLGPRQVGKTTLALEVGAGQDALYLDLESEQDRAKLAQPELYLADHRDRLVILDEVHRAPGLLPVLRGQIDKGRRAGRRTGQYLLVDLLLVRRLAPWHANLGKRLVKSPKVYVRDSGAVHALLGIPDRETLLAHPVVGQSWECFVIENLLTCAPEGVLGHFYRSSGGAEIDLLLAWPNGHLWAIEIKRSLTPRLERGFHAACDDLGPLCKFVVYPGAERYRVAPDIEAIPLLDLAPEVQAG